MSEGRMRIIMRSPSCAMLVIMTSVRVCVGAAQSDAAFDSSRQLPVILINTNHATIPSKDPANCAIAVSQRTLDFGSVHVGSLNELTFTVQTVGAGVLGGTATVSAPFHVLAGSPYALKYSQRQTITVQYAPQSKGVHMTVVHLTGGAGATVTVMGSAASPKTPAWPRAPAALLAGH
jgi:hypothetical protein